MSKYASNPFEVNVFHSEVENGSVVALVIEGGLKTPVICKKNHTAKPNLRMGTIYTRTLMSNGKISSAPATHGDLENIVTVCHNNRIADIGAFLRRHLSDGNIEVLATKVEPLRTPRAVDQFSTDSTAKLFHLIKKAGNDVLRSRGWMYVTFRMPCDLSAIKPDREWVSNLLRKNPNLTGWPIFVDLWNARIQSQRPEMTNRKIWESRMFADDAMDYWRIDGRRGLFFAARAFWDDTSPKSPAPNECMDIINQIRNVAETISVANAFANHLCSGKNDKGVTVQIVFRWAGIDGRQIANWTNPSRHFTILEKNPHVTDTQAEIEIPMHLSNDEVTLSTETVINELTASFGGWKVPSIAVSQIVDKLLRRQW